ncbi:glycogen debranching protein GlgX [Ornithinimicrobium sufpigmenti]|uniref:glycogen debranching protein GlgX n=1 Tax=Ornithinimicrobium sufpigmenti TaxID=2508882 RepID=UPI0010361A28|nr:MULTISPECIES: glycogen debranching protein GlgX [unclassified Ornithinimicrobium]
MPPLSRPRRRTDRPPPLGLTRTEAGPELAVLARHATAVEVEVFGDDGAHAATVPLTRNAYGIWWDSVPQLLPGTRYGLRVDGPWAPEQGHRHNPAKLLLDPYAGAVEGEVSWVPEVYGHRVDRQRGGGHLAGDPGVRDDRDSAPHVPRSVVVDHDRFDWAGDTLPRVPWTDTVIYEAHVRGLTMRHPEVPPELRGTYAGLAHPAVVEHLVELGVTTVELLPVHAFTSEPRLVRQGLSNYWGYNTLGFFAPHPRYAAAQDPQAVVDEVKGAVQALHAAGLEVILDVVYNHTAEQGSGEGPTLSWRGLDNRSYYRLDGRGRDIDVTGCGNTVDLREPMVARMVLDSLRHWVERYHVDGFRFDLAPALARGRDDAYDRDHPFHVALQTDPVLSQVKLIAEPWDVGVHGWRTGQFPGPMAEWNDRYRDGVRSFWLADVGRQLNGIPGHGIRDLAPRLAGSADLFGHDDRGPTASVNYVASHDGFTLADLTAYEQRHNYANGEDNRDGHGDNRSFNHGVEGPSTDPLVRASRERSVRNLLATVLLSTGVPMLLGGDEMGRTQEGNNNAYCQDSPLTWVDWQLEPWQREVLVDARSLTELRRELAVLRPAEFPLHDAVPGRSRLRWYDEHGHQVTEQGWQDPWRRTVVAVYDSLHQDADGTGNAPDTTPQVVALVLHAGPDRIDVRLPTLERVLDWTVRWTSERPAAADSQEQPADLQRVVGQGEVRPTGATSFTVLVGRVEHSPPGR